MDLNIDKKYIYLLNLLLVYFIYIKFDMEIYECSQLTHIFAIISGLLCIHYDCNLIIFIIGSSFLNFHSIHQLYKVNRKSKN
tara:strand:+ start:3417 stop:3662 length:246 start_codon:yes stop_codon:yes gene_type:complete